MRILLLSDRPPARGDEGIANLASALASQLRLRHAVLALAKGAPSGPRHEGMLTLPMNGFLLNLGLIGMIRRFRPDVVLYIPWTSGTPRTFLRARVLRVAARAPVVLFLTQPYEGSAWERAIIRSLPPEGILAQSEAVLAPFSRRRVPAAFVPSGVDLERFQLPSPVERETERTHLGLAPGDRLVLHVGHINMCRLDPEPLLRVARVPGLRLVIVGSTDTPQDENLVHPLREAGVIVIRDFLPRIDLLYGAADVYLFPTRGPRSSIGVPLSVLEALACGIPVVSTRFEGLPLLFPATPYVRFFTSTDEMMEALAETPSAPDTRARALVEPYGWPAVAARVEGCLVNRSAPDAGQISS